MPPCQNHALEPGRAQANQGIRTARKAASYGAEPAEFIDT